MKKLTTWRPDTCDCIIQYEWDTNDPEATRVHTGKNIHSACSAHTGIADAHEHFLKVLEENQRKNLTLNTIIQTFPHLTENKEANPKRPPSIWFKEGHEPKWGFDKDRNLVVLSDKLTEEEKQTLKGLVHKDKVKIV